MLGFQLRNRIDKAAGSGGSRLPVWASGAASAAIWGELSDPALYQSQAERYSRSDLVYMCVNKMAEMAAMLARHLSVFNADGARDAETGKPTERIDDHPFLELWRRPNPWDSTFEFMEATIISLELTGNSFWLLDDGSKPVTQNGKPFIALQGPPIAIWPMRPDRVQIKPDREKYIGSYIYTVGGQAYVIDPGAVRHFKRYHPLRDYEGLSPIEAANYASSSDIAAQKSNWTLFRNSMRLSGIVESDRDHVSPEEINLMEKYLLERYTGSAEKAHQVAFLWSQFKYKELGMNMKDAEFINGAKMNRMRIFGIFGVHPAMVLSEDVNLANAKVGEYVTKAFTLAPKLERIAGDITPILSIWPGTQPAEAYFSGVVPQDTDSESTVAGNKADALQKLVQALGAQEGVLEAKRQRLISHEVNEAAVKPAPAAPPGGGGGFGSVFPGAGGGQQGAGAGRQQGSGDGQVFPGAGAGQGVVAGQQQGAGDGQVFPGSNGKGGRANRRGFFRGY